MNPGVVEETGATARSAVNALAGTPIILALVILQVLTLLGITYSIYNRQIATNTIIHRLIDICTKPEQRSDNNPANPTGLTIPLQ